MYNSNLIAKFQLDISIFEGLAIYQTLLQSLKQNTNRSAHLCRNFSSGTRAKSFLGLETITIPYRITPKKPV